MLTRRLAQRKKLWNASNNKQLCFRLSTPPFVVCFVNSSVAVLEIPVADTRDTGGARACPTASPAGPAARSARCCPGPAERAPAPLWAAPAAKVRGTGGARPLPGHRQPRAGGGGRAAPQGGPGRAERPAGAARGHPAPELGKRRSPRSLPAMEGGGSASLLVAVAVRGVWRAREAPGSAGIPAAQVRSSRKRSACLQAQRRRWSPAHPLQPQRDLGEENKPRWLLCL